MRLMKFVSEGVSIHDTDENIAALIHKECSEFFKETNGLRLFRGTKRNIAAFEKIRPRQDRQPKDTPQVIHEYLDKWFQKKFGWKARSEGVFVSPRSDQTEHYGAPYWFIPCNGYKYVYSPKIWDIVAELESVRLMDNYEGRRSPSDLWEEEDERDQIMEDLLSSYTNRNIKSISGLEYEVSFHCPNGYYLLNTGWMSARSTRYFTIYNGP